MPADVLSARALGRATLARQSLLERTDRSVLDAVRDLVGLQAQLPLGPYLSLWSRLAPFDPGEVGRLLIDRELVRIVVMRSTIHLVTAADCLEMRPIFQPVMEREMAAHPEFAPKLVGVDLDAVAQAGRAAMATEPLSGPKLRAALVERFPDLDAAALAFACRIRLPLVQVPPRGVWGQSKAVTTISAEDWLGRPMSAAPSIDDMFLRYFAAYGPSTVADASTWSRLTGLREVVDRIRPRLRAFRDERGRELFDVPDAPRPDPDTPAPTRFLPEYDNVLLSHADRSRFIPAGVRRVGNPAAVVHGSVLHDGTVAATYRIDRDKASDSITMIVEPALALSGRGVSSIEAEARRALAFLHPDTSQREVRVAPPP